MAEQVEQVVTTSCTHFSCMPKPHQFGGFCHVPFSHANICALIILQSCWRDWVNWQIAVRVLSEKLDMFLKQYKVDSIHVLYLISIALTQIKIAYLFFFSLQLLKHFCIAGRVCVSLLRIL
jgi:hypothetical protein